MSQPARKEKPVLNRQHFTTSRTMEFFSEKELTAQTGHRRDDWGAVVLKEAIDNALDGCEDAGIAPVIHVTIATDRIAIKDNGPGIPGEMVERIFEAFVSTKNSGTGLGLALTQQIISDHGGTIEVGNSSTGGAAFKINFPPMSA